MRRKDGYILCKMAKNCYILPYGQNIADHMHGIQVNETGSFLWNLLEEDCTKEELLNDVAKHYHAKKEDLKDLESDIDEFLEQLSALGILEMESLDSSNFENINYSSKLIEIGGLFLQWIGPNEAFPPEFENFVSNARQAADQRIEAIYGDPRNHVNGKILLRNQHLIICEEFGEYIFLFPKAERLLEGHMSQDGKRVRFYYHGARDQILSTELFHAMRLSYLYLAQIHGCFALHSASILYHNKAWLFSGASGTGKSTHTNLWNELLQTPILNGDLNLISIRGKEPVIYGMPWCGTSGICQNKSHPLGGIVLLKQSQTNRCLELSADEAQLLLMQRMISPAWDEKLMKCNLDFAGALIKFIPVYRLLCTKEPLAVKTIKEKIDRDLG